MAFLASDDASFVTGATCWLTAGSSLIETSLYDSFVACFLLAIAPCFFETGGEAPDGARFHRNIDPANSAARMASSSRSGAFFRKRAVPGTCSSDLGRRGLTWSEPKLLIEESVKMDGDPNILVDGSASWSSRRASLCRIRSTRVGR